MMSTPSASAARAYPQATASWRAIPPRVGADLPSLDSGPRPSCSGGEPLAHLICVQQLSVYAIEMKRVYPACKQLKMMRAVTDREHAALTEHDIESKLLRQSLVQTQSEIVEVCALGVRSSSSALLWYCARYCRRQANPLDHGHLPDAVLLGQVVRRRKSMPTATNDNHVIARLRVGGAPQLRPVFVKRDRVAG